MPASRRNLIACAAAVAAAASMPHALAQGADYPNRAMRIVVPFAPGGGGDVLGRLFAQKMAEGLRQPVIVENKPGASTMIGSDLVAKAAPDGYTLLLNVPLLVQAPSLYTKLPLDPLADLAPVAELVTSPQWLAVSAAKTPARTFAEFIALARQRPQEYNYASIGPGSSGHLLGYALNEANGLGMMHVAYKGSAPAMMALLGGEISAVFLDYVTIRPQLESGKLRLLAVTGARRSPVTPDVPTLAELGYPGFEAAAWAGLFVPARTPREVVARLEAEVQRVLALPDVLARVRELGYEPGAGAGGAAGFAQQVRADSVRWGALIRKAGVKLD